MLKNIQLSLKETFTNEITKTVEDYLNIFSNEKVRLSQLKKQLSENSDLSDRKNYAGHITGGALIINDNNRVLLINHKILDRWLPPGGHYDLPEKIYDTGKREAEEETGVKGLILHSWHIQHNMIPFDIDTHYIPENKNKNELEHFHFDFRYIFRCHNQNLNILKSEILGARWVTFTEAEQLFSNYPWNKAKRILNI